MGIKNKVVLGTVLIGGFCILGEIDYSEALTQEAIEKEMRARRVAQPYFIHPLDYQAIVCQRMYYAEQPRCRFYAERAK